MFHLSKALVFECKEALLTKKADILNRLQLIRVDFQTRDKGKDETDLSMNNIAETQFVHTSKNLRSILLEIESALSRIENKTYGVCEETFEEIEINRLKSIPWTRLSIEGAEIREALKSRYRNPKLRLLTNI